ncbi:zf-HC2 domain-containing protein, partial [candidate division KSB1 bacterium]|nr:zf-HC2 domain-containing protein [candidate division KSB1 bacterium]
MKPCQHFETLLTEKLFGELDALQEQQLNTHLAGCEACRAALAALQNVLQAVGKPARPHMPEHFWEGYWDRLRARMEKEEQPRAS